MDKDLETKNLQWFIILVSLYEAHRLNIYLSAPGVLGSIGF